SRPSGRQARGAEARRRESTPNMAFLAGTGKYLTGRRTRRARARVFGPVGACAHPGWSGCDCVSRDLGRRLDMKSEKILKKSLIRRKACAANELCRNRAVASVLSGPFSWERIGEVDGQACRDVLRVPRPAQQLRQRGLSSGAPQVLRRPGE